MKRYKIQLKGENFLLNFTGDPRKFSFQATKYLRARSPEDAEKMAIIMIRQTPELRDAVITEKSDRPKIILESLREINSLHFLLKKSSTRLTFQAEDEDL